MRRKWRVPRFVYSMSIAIGATLFLVPASVDAVNERSAEVKLFAGDSHQLIESFLIFPDQFKGGATVATGDFGGDGIDEVVVGAGPGGGPQVRVFTADGAELNNFFAFNDEFRGGLSVAAGDLDGDGRDEIIVGAGRGGGPQVQVFDFWGTPQFTNGFFAYHREFRGGVNVAAGDLDGDGIDEIITAPKTGGGPHVRVFDRSGQSRSLDTFPFHEQFDGGVSVAAADIDGGADELIVAVERYDQSWVKVLRLTPTVQVVGEFRAFPESFTGGVRVAAGDVDGDGLAEVAVAPSGSGGPQVRVFEASGSVVGQDFFAYEEEFRGGLSLAVGRFARTGNETIITAPGKFAAEGRPDLVRYIEIDLSDQTLTYYDAGVKVGEYIISSGKPGMDTPTGTFKVINKAREAYSSRYALYMPSWMAFTSQGHGIHGLPFWKLRGGGRYYEGIDHLGRKVSHGCVRVSVDNAARLWEWSEVGTPVVVQS